MRILAIILTFIFVTAHASDSGYPDYPSKDVMDFMRRIQSNPELLKEIKSKAEKGDAESQLFLGYAYSMPLFGENTPEAIKWFKKSANQDNLEATFTLINIYSSGVKGINKDHAESLKWLQKAGELGSPYALALLGDKFKKGRGVKKNDTEAFNLYKKSAENGNIEAQSDLAQCYIKGIGVAIDIVEGYAWLNIICSRGHALKLDRDSLSDLQGQMSAEQIEVGQRRSKEILSEIESKNKPEKK